MLLDALLDQDEELIEEIRHIDPDALGDLFEIAYLSRVCEEGLATSILDAMRQPVQLTTAVLDFRDYRRAKHDLDIADEDHPVEPSLWVDLNIDVVAAIRELRRGE